MRQPLKLMSLRGSAVFDPDVKGLIRYVSPQECAYFEVMGREAPPPPPEGTLEYEQWNYRKGGKRSAVELAVPNAKPARKAKKPRRGRKPVDV